MKHLQYQKTSISKKEASKYIEKQGNKQDEMINTALADALAKLKL